MADSHNRRVGDLGRLQPWEAAAGKDTHPAVARAAVEKGTNPAVARAVALPKRLRLAFESSGRMRPGPCTDEMDDASTVYTSFCQAEQPIPATGPVG